MKRNIPTEFVSICMSRDVVIIKKSHEVEYITQKSHLVFIYHILGGLLTGKSGKDASIPASVDVVGSVAGTDLLLRQYKLIFLFLEVVNPTQSELTPSTHVGIT